MLSLEAGGSTTGIALKPPYGRIDEDLRVIWIRETVNGAYIPTWAPITFQDGTTKTALVFVANPNHVWHETHADIPHIASFVAAASGPLGTNADYVRQLRSALKACDLTDRCVEDLAAELDRIAGRPVA